MQDATQPSQPVSTAALVAAGMAGLVVAVVAMVVSYTHMHELCVRTGEGDLAKLIPASVDGLVFFASTLLYVQHRAGEPKSGLAVFAVVLGVAVSLAANVVAKVPDLVPLSSARVVVAAWSPAALGLVGHLAWKLLTIALRARQEHAQDHPRTLIQANIGNISIGARDDGREASRVVPERLPEVVPGNNPDGLPGTTRELPRKTVRKPSGKAARNIPDDDLMVFVRKTRDDLAAEGRKLTGYVLRKALQADGHRVGNDRASRLAERALAEVGS